MSCYAISSDDANGNTTTKTDSSGTTTYGWDFENRLVSAALPGSAGTVYFKYDPFGRRIYKSSSAGTSIFVYDGDDVTEETNSSGVPVARYTQGEDTDEALAMLRSATTSFYETDGIGSVTSLSNSTGTLAQTYTFDSFGNQTASSGSLTNSFRYTGREFDTETNLYFYRARYYDPQAGRFVSEDPTGFDGGENFYAYVGNDPTVFRDPLGLDRIVICQNQGTLTLFNNQGKPIFKAPATPGCSSSPTPNGHFHAGPWQKNKTNPKYPNTRKPYSDPWWGWYSGYGPWFLPINGPGGYTGTGIHGTWFGGHGMPWNCSHGCVRLSDSDIETLHDKLPNPVGTPIDIKQDCGTN